MNRQVDLVYLELYGVGTYHRLPAAEERAFAKAHQGQAGALRAVVGYADGATAEAYEGELEGRVVFPIKGAAPFGFNRLWLPDGCAQTLGELGEAFFAIHPRVKPLVELASQRSRGPRPSPRRPTAAWQRCSPGRRCGR